MDKRLAIVLVAISTFPAWKQDAATKDAATKDLKELQGTWRAIHIARAGKPAPREEFADLTIGFDGDGVTIKNKRFRTLSRLKLNPSRKPKEIDLTIQEGAGAFQKGTTLRGIYSFDNGKLLLNLGIRPDEPRPDDFTSRPDSRSQSEMFILERARHAATDPPVPR
jgi:uncharacterized protein (TIGR03067 family)